MNWRISESLRKNRYKSISMQNIAVTSFVFTSFLLPLSCLSVSLGSLHTTPLASKQTRKAALKVKLSNWTQLDCRFPEDHIPLHVIFVMLCISSYISCSAYLNLSFNRFNAVFFSPVRMEPFTTAWMHREREHSLSAHDTAEFCRGCFSHSFPHNYLNYIL